MLALRYTMTGGREVKQAIKLLGPKMAKKPIRKGLRAGAKVFQQGMKSEVSVDSGFLKKNIKVRAGKPSKNRISVLATSGDPKKSNLNSGEAFYGGFVEYGHDGGGWFAGAVEAQPFLRPAFDRQKRKARKVASETIRREAKTLYRSL